MNFPKTTKFHIENYLFLPIIKIFWEPFSGKQSHWWNWSNTKKSFFKSVHVKGDQSLHPLNNLWHILIQLNFVWKKMVILEPIDYKVKYQLAYSNSTYKEICSILSEGRIACLVNQQDTEYTGFTYPDGKEISLRIVQYVDKKNLPKRIPFL